MSRPPPSRSPTTSSSRSRAAGLSTANPPRSAGSRLRKSASVRLPTRSSRLTRAGPPACSNGCATVSSPVSRLRRSRRAGGEPAVSIQDAMRRPSTSGVARPSSTWTAPAAAPISGVPAAANRSSASARRSPMAADSARWASAARACASATRSEPASPSTCRKAAASSASATSARPGSASATPGMCPSRSRSSSSNPTTVSTRLPLAGTTRPTSASRRAASAVSPHRAATWSPSITWVAVGPPSASSRRRCSPSAPSAAWARTTPRSPATSSIASVCGVQRSRQRAVIASSPPTPTESTASP